MKKNLDGMWELISTWFYVGKSRYAPGTVGSLATLPVVAFFQNPPGWGPVCGGVVRGWLPRIFAAAKN